MAERRAPIVSVAMSVMYTASRRAARAAAIKMPNNNRRRRGAEQLSGGRAGDAGGAGVVATSGSHLIFSARPSTSDVRP